MAQLDCMRLSRQSLVTLLLAVPAISARVVFDIEGGTLEYVFEAGEQNSPNA
jgi:hypothetical protein